MSMPQSIESFNEPSFFSTVSTYEDIDTREQMNRILAEADMSLVRSQTRTLLKHQSESSLRRLVSKLNKDTQAFQGKK